MTMSKNLDDRVVADFGQEWLRFDQAQLEETELKEIFQLYFAIFPWQKLPVDSIGFDLGCGSGRWAREVAKRVGTLHCIDPSDAIEVAKRNLSDHENCVFHRASVADIPLPDSCADFGYSLGVLHHVPDTQAGIRACVQKLKPGAPFLIYLYHAFEDRPLSLYILWKLSNLVRSVLCRTPHGFKCAFSEVAAVLFYWPLARMARVVELLGLSVHNFPLSQYRHRSFYVMRTDALDRFGTRLEKRFTRAEIQAMMTQAGLTNIHFSESAPFWVGLGFKKERDTEHL